ncbi:ribonuclease H-like domain-containing protein [Rhodanobacter sp. AS-Z3]|nr:ribonuclease H-like domain-containing protein [Rhodanobacter sp. AS-Z3]WEN13820.1 ribonuclease H-like domain-containing protein [Rhodanobacter sp. AS-Z3]
MPKVPAPSGLANFLAAAVAPQNTRPASAASLATANRTLSPELRRLLQRHAQLKHGPSTLVSSDREVPGVEIAPGLRYTEEFADWLNPPAVIDATFARMEPVHHYRLLHFDTETTGLAGGTGTRAFMIGAADWIDGRFRIRQLVLTTMAAETAMLRTFAEWLSADTVLVSYNGKCYDAPLLATRYRLARLANPLAGLGHLDLLHPVRRHWKHQWENCRLATAERQLLGVVREDDLPGSEAPAAWLTYLRGGSARNLRRVAAHNAQDLKSLAGVLLHMAGSSATPG